MREKNRAGETSLASNPAAKKRPAGGRKPAVIRVLVAEDHSVVRDGLVAIIKQEADMDVVAETGDGPGRRNAPQFRLDRGRGLGCRALVITNCWRKSRGVEWGLSIRRGRRAWIGRLR